MMINNFQKIGANSNAEVGSKFEDMAREYFRTSGFLRKGGIWLEKPYALEVGFS